MINGLNRTLKALVCGMFVLAPAMAGASKSYHGDDYSYDSNNREWMYSCDRESDSHKVHGDYHTGQGYSALVRDGNGANGDCASQYIYGLGLGRITEHRTCEEKVAWPDDCWGWVAAG